jgi:hypothetical protein
MSWSRCGCAGRGTRRSEVDGAIILGLLSLAATVASPFLYGWWEKRQRPAQRGLEDGAQNVVPVATTARIPSPRSTPRVPLSSDSEYPDFFKVGELPGDPRTFLRQASPRELANSIAGIPPLNRQKVGDEVFQGHWVRWHGKVADVRDLGSYYAIEVYVENHLTTLIFPKTRRREIELVRDGDALRFEGQIARFSPPSTVDLVHVEFAVC